MKKYLLTITACVMALTAMAQVPAFPGAEGHGRYVTGGRGGEVRHVTNLNNSGEGSFRWAVSGSNKKIVVFDVGGVIALNSDLTIGANTTIEGQTAPAPGITIRYYTVQPSSNCIIRFIRFRRGSEKNTNDGADAMWQRHVNNVLIDHCSFSWSIDEVASFYDNNNFTMQWCTLGESLNNAGHGKGAHGYGGIWGGKLASFHHNMICHVNNRSPRFNGARYNWTGYTSNERYSEYQWENAVQAEIVDFRNCVIYNCGNGCYGGPGGGYINMVNNYYKTGPAGSTSRVTSVSIANSTSSSDNQTYWDMTSRYYIQGNQVNSNANYDWNNISYDSGVMTYNAEKYTKDPNHYYGNNVSYVNISGVDCVKIKLDNPTETGEVTTHDATTAFDKVLSYAGASLHRDNVDERYETEARNGTATYSGSVTGKPGRIDLVSDVNGYTEENFGTGSRPANFDADNDGMADAWEQANGGNLDPNSYDLDPKEYYTNIEVYCNNLVEHIMKAGNADAISPVDEYYPTCTYVDVNPDDDDDDDNEPIEGTEGTIKWELNSTTTATYATSIADYLGANSLTMGSNLSTNGYGTYGDVRFLKFTATTAESSAAETNSVRFTVKTKSGYKFRATNVSFQACKIGTDNGNFDVKWVDGGGTTVLASPVAPNRNNEAGGYFSYLNYSLKEHSNATDGDCTLLLNLYNVGFIKEGVMTKKEMGLANVIIQGVIISSTGITTPVVLNLTDASTYNLQGQRVDSYYKGIVIRNGKKILNK